MLKKHLDPGPGSQSLFGNRTHNSVIILLASCWPGLLSLDQRRWLGFGACPGPGKAGICSGEPGACGFGVGASWK